MLCMQNWRLSRYLSDNLVLEMLHLCIAAPILLLSPPLHLNSRVTVVLDHGEAVWQPFQAQVKSAVVRILH